MRAIMAYLIRYPIVVNLGMLLVMVLGLLSLAQMKATFFPEQSIQFINIQAVYPGASPEEMEEGIVTKIEDNLRGVSGIDRTTSTSSENAATVTVELETGADADQVLQDVNNAVDQISSFPLGMEPLVVFKVEQLDFAYSFALSGDVNLVTLKEAAQAAEDELLAIDGISKVALTGYPDREIEIALREADMRAYNLTFEQVALAISSANLQITGGQIKTPDQELNIRANTKEYQAEQLGDIVVKAQPDGRVVLLRQIADLNDQWADDPTRSYFNGQPAAVITVQTTNDEDILEATTAVREFIENFNATHTDIKASTLRDGSVNLRERISLLVWNGSIGALLVVIFLALFLNWRVAFWVALGIPFCFLGMFLLGGATSLTINIISLFGMILVVGILVDDGVVVGEKIYQEFEAGATPTQAAMRGTLSVLPSVLAAIATTVAAFALFYFIDGTVGEFFSDVAFVVITTLVLSLVEVATALPAHLAHSKALRPDVKPSYTERKLTQGFDFLKDRMYKPLLKAVLRYQPIAFAVFILLLILSVGLLQNGYVKTTFFPNIEADNVQVDLELPSGTPAHQTEEVLQYIEQQIIAATDSIEQFGPDTGRLVTSIQLNIGPNSNQGNVIANLRPSEERSIRSFDAGVLFGQYVGRIPQAEKLTFGNATPFGKPISISLSGRDRKELSAAAARVKAYMQGMEELKDVADTDQEGPKEVYVRLKQKARLLGLTEATIMAQVRRGFFGYEAQRLQRGRDEVKVWVRYDLPDRSSIEALRDMRIRTAEGTYPLRELADFSIEPGVIAINHMNGRREIRIDADVANSSVSATDVTVKLQNEVLPTILADYQGISFSFEGQARTSAKAGTSAAVAGPIVLLIIVAMIILTFRSVGQALLVLLLIPFTLVGVIAGHWLHGVQFSFILSGLGVVALIGVLVNDSLVFISALNTNLKQGMPYRWAVFRTATSRFRPIVLTSVTTIAGLAPLILERSFQAQFLIPMAIAVAYGLAMATILTLLMLPLLLVMLNNLRVYTVWAWKGYKPYPSSVEPAYREGILSEARHANLQEANLREADIEQ